jgi:hypothetical protein
MAVYTALLHDQISVVCIICDTQKPITEMTPGSLYADQSQAFACTAHLYDRERWINAWAVFENDQEITELCRGL